MDVTLHWSGPAPAHLQPLLDALTELPEIETAPEGAVTLCPDATVLDPPIAGTHGLVAIMPHDVADLDDERLARLRRWAQTGAQLLFSTDASREQLLAPLALAPARTATITLPLPPERLPEPTPAGGDLLLHGTISSPAMLHALALVRLAGFDRRSVITDQRVRDLAEPGSEAGRLGLMGGTELLVADDWRDALATAAVVVLTDATPDAGWAVREALASGRPVVVPSTRWMREHLDRVGATAYVYEDFLQPVGLSRAIVAALRGDRGPIEAPARDAVLAESWEPAARGVLHALVRSLGEPAAPAPAHHAPRVEVGGQGLEVCVLNPHASSGGGERFMRELVEGMARDASRPRITLVCGRGADYGFDPDMERMREAGIEVVTAAVGEVVAAAAPAMRRADVVYCSWPHLSEPPECSAPLVCTFHDVNWKHFKVFSGQQVALLERQTPQWIARCEAIVHSAHFIREEFYEYYGAPRTLTHVIPLAAWDPPEPATAEEIAALRRRFALPERFLLSPAGFSYHKNHAGLDAALRRLRAAGRPVTVLATGAATSAHFHGPDLIGAGLLRASELQAAYAACSGVVQTSLYEAGSFPMIEAMMAERPVAISRIAAVVEQIERMGLHAELFDPLDPDDIASAILRLWDGAGTDHLQTNRAGVAARTWDDVGSDYLRLLERVAGAGAVAPVPVAAG